MIPMVKRKYILFHWDLLSHIVNNFLYHQSQKKAFPPVNPNTIEKAMQMELPSPITYLFLSYPPPKVQNNLSNHQSQQQNIYHHNKLGVTYFFSQTYQ